MINTALGLIDIQRGFMPQEEGEKLNLPGFGELPVRNGEAIIPNVNKLLAAFAINNSIIFTTQDWHPSSTAHFSTNPDYKNNWPLHCVAGSYGAKLHPNLIVNNSIEQFKKGMEVLEDGRDDLSYSGLHAVNSKAESLGDWLEKKSVTQVVLGGLALDYCVGRTALDLRKELGLDVVVVLNATKAIDESSATQMLENFKSSGIKIANTEQVLQHLSKPVGVQR